MTTMPLAHPRLAASVLIALLAGAAISAVRLLRHQRSRARYSSYLTDPTADAGHLVMNLTMALMVGPWYAAWLKTPVVCVLALLTAAFTALLIRHLVRPPVTGQPARVGVIYHLLAAGIMVYVAVTMPADMSGMTGMVQSPPLSLTILAVVFGLDAVVTAAIVLAAPDAALAVARTGAADRPSTDPAATTIPGCERFALRVASIPHVVMDAAMVLMLLNLLR